MKELGGEMGVLVVPLPLVGPIPTLGQLSESEEKHLRQKGKWLICGTLNGMRI